MKDKLWWVLLGLAAILMLSNARAGEWNEKPVMCEQKEQFESLMVEQGKIILGGGDMFATVRTKNGLSDIPAVLPMRLYINPSNIFYSFYLLVSFYIIYY